MSQIKQLYSSLTVWQRWAVVVVAITVVAGILGLSRWQRDRNFKPLYNSLAAEDAAGVLQKLRESGTEYRLTENGTTVLVPSERVAELRLELAGAGLPKSGRIGFELFDKTNFGMTEFTEHVNYRRALEGELERSVMSLAEVEQARVHLTFPKESVFTEQREPAKASVMLKLRSGTRMAPQNVSAIAHLVSSAVEGLTPEGVSVLDMRGNLLSRPRPKGPAEAQESEAALEYRQQLEKDMVGKVTATLEPLLGREKFRVAASVDCDLTSGEQSEENFDPTKSVMATSSRTEDQNSASRAEGQPGIASNLPRPPEKTSGGNGNVHRTENITYQTSRTVRRTKIPQGVIKHVSLAVLLDQNVRWEGAGPKARKVLVPPSPETIKTIHEVVAAAVGLSTQRGDQLTVETLPFESTMNADPPELPAAPRPAPAAPVGFDMKNPQHLMIVGGAGVGLLLLVGTCVVLWTRGRRRVLIAEPVPEFPPGLDAGTAAKRESALASIAGMPDALIAQEPAELPAITASRHEVLIQKLRESARAEAALYAGILRGWIEEETEA